MGAAILATKYDGEVVELQQIRWQRDLTGAQRAAIASEAERKRGMPEYEWGDPRSLYVDETYQRPISYERVWDIATNFNWQLFEPLWIGRRKDDKLYVVDGRHRLAASLIVGPQLIPEIPLSIRRTTGVEEEAQIFVLLQEKRRSLSSSQRFAAKLVFKDPIAIALQRLMTQRGFKVPTETFSAGFRNADSFKDSITAIATLEEMYAQGGAQRVAAVLDIIRQAWDGVPPTTSGKMLRALSGLVEKSNLQASTIARRLHDWDPWAVIERGERHSHSNQVPAIIGMVDVLDGLVNAS